MKVRLAIDRGQALYFDDDWVLWAEAVLTDQEQQASTKATREQVQRGLQADLSAVLGVPSVWVELGTLEWIEGHLPHQLGADAPEPLRGLGESARQRWLDLLADRLTAEYAPKLFPTLQWFVIDWLRQPKNALLAGALSPNLVPFASELL